MFELDSPRRDPRDVPPTPASSLRLSRLPDFVESLDARVDALAPVEQLDLAEQLAGSAATLDWQRCRLASSFALRECGSPNVAASASRRGGIVMQRLGGVGTPEVPESAITELALAFSQSEYAARDLIPWVSTFVTGCRTPRPSSAAAGSATSTPR